MELINNPNTSLLIAPYGDTSNFEKYVKYGVLKLIRTGCPVVCTRGFFNWKEFRYEVLMSDPFNFKSDMSDESILLVLNQEYRNLKKIYLSAPSTYLPIRTTRKTTKKAYSLLVNHVLKKVFGHTYF